MTVLIKKCFLRFYLFCNSKVFKLGMGLLNKLANSRFILLIYKNSKMNENEGYHKKLATILR